MSEYNRKLSTYTFQASEEIGIGEPVRLGIGFTISEADALLELMNFSRQIRVLLINEGTSILHREFSTGSNLGVPWGYALQDREYTLGIIRNMINSIDSFFYKNCTDRLLGEHFSNNAIESIENFRKALVDFYNRSIEA